MRSIAKSKNEFRAAGWPGCGLLDDPDILFRFDVVEVIMPGRRRAADRIDQECLWLERTFALLAPLSPPQVRSTSLLMIDPILSRAIEDMRAGRLEAALDSVREVLKTRPQDHNAAQILALLLVQSGRLEEALPHLAGSGRGRAPGQPVSKQLRQYSPSQPACRGCRSMGASRAK